MDQATIGIIVTGLILVFVGYIIVKDWLSEWEGKLIDKKEVYESDTEGYKQKKRKLIFDIGEGKTKRVDVNKRTYNNANIGDTYKKAAKSFKPKKI